MEKEVKSPNEVVVESETVVQPAEPKPKKRVGLTIMLVVLVLLLVGGALALGYLWGKNNLNNGSQSSQGNNSQTTNSNESNSSTQNQTENGSTPSSESGALTITEAEKILEKYIGKGNGTIATPFNAFYGTFSSKFDEQQKVFLAYQAINENEKETVACTDQRYEQGTCTGKSVSYDLMNEKYKSLFGDYGSIEKKNYSFQNFFYLVYDDSIDAYREFIFPGGGTTSIIAAHKIITVKKSGNDMVVVSTFATINTSMEEPSEKSTVVREPGSSPITMISLPNSITNEIIDSMAIYEFTLSPYGDSYVLTAVEKVE